MPGLRRAAGKRPAPSDWDRLGEQQTPSPEPARPLPLMPVRPRADGAGPSGRPPTPEEENTQGGDEDEDEDAHTQGNPAPDTQPADEPPYDWSRPALSTDPDVAWDHRFWNQHSKEGGRTLGRDRRYGDEDFPIPAPGEVEELRRRIRDAERQLAQGDPERRAALEQRLLQLKTWLALLM